jgi:putative tryptophan/tyrosine transport system substrate-binding protein
MNRREFITLLGGAAAAWPLTARAQQGERIRRVGVLLAAYTEADRAGQARIAAFRNALQQLGWNEGRNVQLDYRWSGGSVANAGTLAADLMRSAPDVIVVAGDPALTQLNRLPGAIPIVFTQVSEAVDSGFVASLAQPGGNITGFQNFEPAMGGKWLSVLKEIAPGMKRAGALFSADAAPHASFLSAAQSAAAALGVTVTVLGIRDRDEIESAISTFGAEPAGGLLVFPHPSTIANRAAIQALAARHRLPAIYPYRYFAADGGLISYGPDQIDQWRGAARYVDRILKGEKPANLPVQAPTRFETAINLKTAEALGIAVPASLLARADEVIE